MFEKGTRLSFTVLPHGENWTQSKIHSDSIWSIWDFPFSSIMKLHDTQVMSLSCRLITDADLYRESLVLGTLLTGIEVLRQSSAGQWDTAYLAYQLL